MLNVIERIESLATKYSIELSKKITAREEEMKNDDNSHYIIYNALGISNAEGYNIDLYQNAGRFLYRYAGTFLEDAALICFQYKYPEAQFNVRIPNTIDNSPRTIEIDCLIRDIAFEVKWRDATTDGDHIKKEHKRVEIIRDKGYVPVRIMFFHPNRLQAITIQNRLKFLYEDQMGGRYYAGEDAWTFIKEFTGVDLKSLLFNIANNKTKR